MTELKNRRPLTSRDTGWAKKISQSLAARNITPNQISVASMAAGLMAGLAFWGAGAAWGGVLSGCLLVVAALGCQLRLLCNLFDGMVAIEAGKSALDGAFWNEFPDRVSDILIFVGLGFGLGMPGLGWAAAALSVLTAYTRELGANIGLEPDFCGPMAKQHRMAVVTLAALLAIAEMVWRATDVVLIGALWIVVVGAGVTILRRAQRIRQGLLKG